MSNFGQLLFSAMLVLFARIAYGQMDDFSSKTEIIETIRVKGNKLINSFNRELNDLNPESDARHNIRLIVKRFARATTILKQHSLENNPDISSIESVLIEAAQLNAFIHSSAVSAQFKKDWLAFRNSLDKLASFCNFNDWQNIKTRPEYLKNLENPGELDSRQILALMREIETGVEEFQSSIDAGIIGLSGESAADASGIGRYIVPLLDSILLLRRRYDDGTLNSDVINKVVITAEPINEIVMNHPISLESYENWIRLKYRLVTLASAHYLYPFRLLKE
jgi:hypothetical protein